MGLHTLTAHELHDKYRAREVSVVEVTQAALDRIAAVDGRIHAFNSVVAEKAMQQAQWVDRKLARGEKLGRLAGIPIALKDNMSTEGIPTTCSSKILENYVPPFDATVTKRLKAQDVVLVGKTNMDEFAFGSTGESSAFETTCNPWDTSMVAGGSSSGSAASVAGDMVPLSLGSDTGGSIRLPAGFCGIVGMKPTYGNVSRFGLIAFGSSLDQIGPFARDVRDCAWMFEAIAGHDPMDSTSAERPDSDVLSSMEQGVSGLRVGLPTEYFGEGTDPRIKEVVMRAVERLTNGGATTTEAHLPHTKYAIPVYYIVACAEASSNLARYDGVRYGYRDESATDILAMFSRSREKGFGSEAKRRIMLGTYVLSAGYYDAYYLKALKVRTLICNDFAKAFEQFDVLVTPICPTSTFPIGSKIDNPLEMYLTDVCSVTVNLAGLPAIVIPAGTVDGLPVGVQLIAKHFDEATLFRTAYALEQELGMVGKRPSGL